MRICGYVSRFCGEMRLVRISGIFVFGSLEFEIFGWDGLGMIHHNSKKSFLFW